MSEVTKPVEEQPAAPVEAAPAVEPTTEAKAEETPAPAVEEPVTAAEPAKDVVEPAPATETPAAPAKAATPAKEFTGEGILGYKAPGGFIKKLAGFSKKWFWFGSEPVESKNLSGYLRGEKPEVANHNAAWSSHTGKGLLYFSKFKSEKATPAGIINLADITDITEDGTVDFFFHMHGAKHVFQASTVAERDSWVSALKTKSVEAKEMVDEVKETEGYKSTHGSLSKPAVVAAAVMPTATKATDSKKEEKAETKVEKKEEKLEAKDATPKARKSRSASRKRNSIFGSFGLGSKKEEATEVAKEDTTEAKEVAPTEAIPTEPAPLDGPSVAAAVIAAPVVDEPATAEAETSAPVEAAKPAETTRPGPTVKRNSSIFGTLSSRFGQRKSSSEKKLSTEGAPAVPAKDAITTEPVSAEAPIIPAPEATEPLAADVEAPADAPVTEPTTTNGVTAAEEAKSDVKPETKTEAATKEKRKSTLPFSFGSAKEKVTEVDGDKSKSAFAKFRQTIKGKTSPKAAEKIPEKPAEKTEEKIAEPTEPAVEAAPGPVISEPVAAAPVAAPEVTATA